MSDHIKSDDLCERCAFGSQQNCLKKFILNCVGCIMYDTWNPGGCKCLTIEPNTPCPYFVEAEDDE